MHFRESDFRPLEIQTNFLECDVIGFCTILQPFDLHAWDVRLSLWLCLVCHPVTLLGLPCSLHEHTLSDMHTNGGLALCPWWTIQFGVSFQLKETMHAYRQAHPHADSYHFACRRLILSNYRTSSAQQNYISHQVDSWSAISVHLMIQHCLLPVSSTKYVHLGISNACVSCHWQLVKVLHDKSCWSHS